MTDTLETTETWFTEKGIIVTLLRFTIDISMLSRTILTHPIIS